MTLAALALLASLTAEPPAERVVPPDAVLLTKAQYGELKASVEQVKKLQSLLDAFSKRIQFLEERAGFRPLTERNVTRAKNLGKVRFGKTVRRFTSLTDKGKKRDLRAVLQRHRATVVTFWATWCKPCTSQAELVHLRALKSELARYGSELISIAVDDAPTVRNGPRSASWLYPYWQVKDGHLDTLPMSMLRTGSVGLPLFLVVDSSGEIRWLRKQALTADAVRDLVTAAVTGH